MQENTESEHMTIVYDVLRRIELAEERARAGTTQTERLFFQDKADELRNRQYTLPEKAESCTSRYF